MGRIPQTLVARCRFKTLGAYYSYGLFQYVCPPPLNLTLVVSIRQREPTVQENRKEISHELNNTSALR